MSPSGAPKGLELQLVQQEEVARDARRQLLGSGRDGIHTVAPVRGMEHLGVPSDRPNRGHEPVSSKASAVPPLQADLSIDRERVHVAHEEGETWLRGSTYKARVAGDGFTYIPFLGSDVPTTYPLRFQLAEATLAGCAIDLDAGTRVEPGPGSSRFAIERGEVEVRYDLVGVNAIEQTMAIDAAGASGPLVLEFDVETAMRAVPQPSGAIRFEAWSGPNGSGQLIGGVDYGAATVLDGSGRQAEMATEWEDGHLRLTVPAEFLAAAEGLVVVDPLISTFAVDTVSGFQLDVDVAYKTQYFSPDDYFVYVYEDGFAGNDVDIYTTVLNFDGTFAFGRYIEMGSENWIDPAVACDLYHALFVAERTNAATNTREIVSRRMELTPGFPVDPVQAMGSTSGNYNDIRPDVASAGNLWTSEKSFIVTWIRDFATDGDVRFQWVDDAGVLGPVEGLEVSPGLDTTVLSIANRPSSAGAPPTPIPIAWGQRNIAADLWTIEAAHLNSEGNLQLPSRTVQAFGPGARPGELHVSSPYWISGNEEPWGIVFDPYDSSDEDTNLLVLNGTGVIAALDVSLAFHTDVEGEQAEVRVATVDERFAVTYLEQDTVAGGWRGYVQTVAFSDPGVLSVFADRTDLGVVTDGPLYHIGGGIPITRYNAFGSPGRFGAMGWSTNVGGEINVRGGVFDFFTESTGSGTTYCLGAENSTGERGMIAGLGGTSSTSTLRLSARRLPQNSLGLFIVGDGTAYIPMAGGAAGVLCVGGSIGRYAGSLLNSGSDGNVDLVIDFASIAQPGGSVASTPGMTWNFSYWHRDSMGSAPTSNFTNALSVQVRN